MGKIAVTEFVSLDGVMEAPGGEPGYAHTNWVSRFPDGGHFGWKLREILADDALLLGRKTYESFAGAWPEREGEFAEKMNAMPKFLVSRTLTEPAWNNTTTLQGEPVEAIRDLKTNFRGVLQVAGSQSLASLLRTHRLVDEYRLMVFPIILGSGRRLFEEMPEAAELRLVDSQSFSSGVVVLTYESSQS